ncbi:hypothetical protein OFL98_27170, partial [Escherichia coli]|nr:hypothetical protein [Escherichia coli]
RFREEDRKEAKRAYEEFAKSMRGGVTTATATDDAEATEQGQAGPGHPVLMPPDDLSHAGRYEPEFQPKEINSLVRQAHMGDL